MSQGKGPLRDETIEEHESFGMISLARYTCNPPQHFFGSSIVHNGGVSLVIQTAERHRSLNSYRYHAQEHLIEINMTPAQLADLLTNLNMGDGIPCTIQWFNGKKMEPCPEVNERKLIHQEFDKKMKSLGDALEELVQETRDLQQKPNVNKGDRARLVKMAETIQAQVAHNIPFIHAQFNEAIDATLNEAKADLESFVSQLTRNMGEEALRRKLAEVAPPILELKDKPTCES